MEFASPSSSGAGSAPTPAASSDVRRPDRIHPYRLSFWADIVSEDSTSEIMNVVGMLLSMAGILLKYKVCAWFGLLAAAVSNANLRANHDGKQIMSTFMLSISSIVMCYLANPQPMSVALAAAAGGQQQQQPVAQASTPAPPAL